MCYNISRGKSLKIDEFNKEISLIYIDDLIKKLLKYVVNKKQNNKFKIININSTKKIKIINLYKKIESFWKAQRNNFLPEIKNQFDKNLYSTFLYYLPRSKIVMPKTIHKDERGIFSEIFKTQNQGQVSIFSINPGKTRGGHFHHSKNEKFVLIKGKTLFRAFDLKNKKKYQLTLQEEKINEVLSIPGHWHEIVNTGKSKAYFLLWSNEVYDKNKPDTFIKKMYKKLKVITIAGTRPELIRLSQIIKKFNINFDHKIIYTGQNFSKELSQNFFKNFNIKPNFSFNIKNKNSIEAISQILVETNKILKKLKPDCLFILGDTNSALSCLVAKKMQIPIFHFEAGNRCFDLRVPEEINRKIIDTISDINLTYSENAKLNLIKENFQLDTIFNIGSPLKEVFDKNIKKINKSKILKQIKVKKKITYL